MSIGLTSGLIAALGIVGLAAPAAALSIAAAKSHDRNRACAAVVRVLANIAGRQDQVFPLITTEALGHVDYNERATFLETMTTSEGRPDDKPLRLRRLYRIVEDKFAPLYVVEVERLEWHENREEQDGMGGVEIIRDPHFSPRLSYWLATFQSDRVVRFREAFELYNLADEERRVKDCGDG